MSPGRVLSIQSHVVHGYVGQKAATFPLQLLGFDVDAFNTVHFSNHTGYSVVRGVKHSADLLNDVVGALGENDLLKDVQFVLSGYVGSAELLRAVLKTVDRLRAEKPVLFVCDPVLGDNGKLYVPLDLIEMFRQEAVHRADILTPNQFEAGCLTNRAINSETDAFAACDDLHKLGCKVVVITSIELESHPDQLILIGSDSRDAIRFRLIMPKRHGYFTGTGDLMAALLLGWTAKGETLPHAAEFAVASVQAVLERTESCGGGELRLIEAQAELRTPEVKFHAEILRTNK
eukprot:TRINITY_DN1055_c0_g2_i2.p1 TRINITY_DN1055_c0_g2~~TRINITY_DN1055_c0_g2_i2.p1  ORF type:complete len:289 (-),score=29.67 TRINITY_DN1055_c0_g2_i2:538-1404(-)